MTEGRVNQRQIELMWTRIGLLWGDRGDPLDAALRKRDLAEMKDLLAGLKVFQKVITGTIQTIQDAIDALELRASTLESRATTVEGRATALETRATALEGRATSLETRATNLEATRLTDAPSDGSSYARLNGAWAALPSQNLTITAYTANQVAVIGNANAYVRMNVASANTFTVPTNATVAFPIGCTITLRQVGAGQTTIVAASGVTINTSETLKCRKQFSTIALTKVGTNEWDIVGDLELVP